MKKTATYGLTHLALAVHDLENTKHFYQTVFDMEVMYEEKDFIQLTTPGTHDILVFEKKSPPAEHPCGIAHFGFRLRDAKDIHAMEAKIKIAGGTILNKGEFVPGSPFVFFQDPDGYEIEVWFEMLPEK